MCKRFAAHAPELFRFVSDPAVPATNNAAERALRPLVVDRKISGGTRSRHGSQTQMILRSLITAWDLHGQDPLTNLLDLLRAHNSDHIKLAPV